MRSDAYITVTCDKCLKETIEIRLTAIACGGYDERYVDDELDSVDWNIANGIDICPGCSEDATELEAE